MLFDMCLFLQWLLFWSLTISEKKHQSDELMELLVPDRSTAEEAADPHRSQQQRAGLGEVSWRSESFLCQFTPNFAAGKWM